MTRWYERWITHTELLTRLKALDKQKPPKVMQLVVRFPVVTTGQAQQRKQA